MRNEEQDIVVIGLGNHLRNDDGAGPGKSRAGLSSHFRTVV